MPFLKVASVREIAPGTVIEAVAGGTSYAVCNFKGELRAFEGTCPHAGGPLGEGVIDGNNLVCPWHAWEYDCISGVNTYDPTVKLAAFPVKIDGDDVFIDVP